MAWLWVGGAATTLAADPPAPAPTPPTPADMQRLAGEIERGCAELEKSQREIPRETFDVKAIVDSVGREPEKLMAWVRDNTTWAPYRGLLRGDRGVLMDRTGSSLDRAMLLYSILRAAGAKPRLAHATLTSDQAKAALQQLTSTPTTAIAPATRPAPATPSDDELKSLATGVVADPSAFVADYRKGTEDCQRMAEEIQKRITGQTAALRSAINTQEKSSDQTELAKRELDAIADHWWVQLPKGDDWTDLDLLSLSGLKPAETSHPEAFTDLKEDQLHLVQVQVFVEFCNHGKATEGKVFEQKLLPAGLMADRIRLTHNPMGWPKDFDNGGEEKTPAKFAETVRAQSEWMPILSVGSRTASRYTFTTDGLVNDTTLPGYAQAALAGRKVAQGVEEGSEKTGSRVGGMLSGHGIGGAGARKPADDKPSAEPTGTQLTAEWVEFTIHTPGRPPEKIRRPIFDLIGPANRAAKKFQVKLTDEQRLERNLAMLGELDIFPQVCDLSSTFITHVAGASALASQRNMLKLLRDSEKLTPAERQAGANQLVRALPSPLLTLARGRRAFSPHRGEVYLDRINVLDLQQEVWLAPDGNVATQRTVDIVNNDVAVRRNAGASPFDARLEQGVTDTVIEGLLYGSGQPVHNTGELTALAQQQNVSLLTIRKHGERALKDLRLPGNVNARVEQDLADGHAVVIPGKPIAFAGADRFAWWRIDPKTGTTLGILDNGYHGGSTASERELSKEEAERRVLESMSYHSRNGVQEFYSMGLRQFSTDQYMAGWDTGYGSGFAAGLKAGVVLMGVVGLLASGIAYLYGYGSGVTAHPPPPQRPPNY